MKANRYLYYNDIPKLLDKIEMQTNTYTYESTDILTQCHIHTKHNFLIGSLCGLSETLDVLEIDIAAPLCFSSVMKLCTFAAEKIHFQGCN